MNSSLKNLIIISLLFRDVTVKNCAGGAPKGINYEQLLPHDKTIDTRARVEAAGGPLGWWEKSSRIYPHIATLARKYLAVQASSAASERVFSVGGLVVTKNAIVWAEKGSEI